jgi:hypothetical protein
VAWTKWSYMDHWVTETPQGPQPPSFSRASMDRDVKQLAALSASERHTTRPEPVLAAMKEVQT